MQLYYYVDPEGNFGDDLNPVIWKHYLPELLDDDPASVFVGIGTVLSERMRQALRERLPPGARKVVFGTGTGYGAHPTLDESWDVRCVRGPLTAAALGLDARLAITDPAILLAAMPTYTAPVTPQQTVSFMPHRASKRKGDWAAICAMAGVRYLDPADPVDDVIEGIRSSQLVVCEAMHAAIVADAFRVPWMPVVCYDHILGFKWEDWCRSLGMTYRPTQMPEIHNVPPRLAPHRWLKSEAKRALRRVGLAPPNWTQPWPRRTSARDSENAAVALQALIKTGEPNLSARAAHDMALERLLEALHLLKRELAPAA